ncbi:helix-turn-helix domain-containing protein [Formosa sediminum]|uniref:Helix-turn-helix domain-containing protein n=1 Tax=Formosa sediminum TaxID=2594004 RepID=A0A516GUQ9_9FLAO|nr:helix-turn-helix domain-containing protein [Formosa sediminum]QDO95258.1 helix-turn-helix domain-containing protein [Formosa sediminum]
MPTSIITTDDLHEFKLELLDDIKRLLNAHSKSKINSYLKSSEVMSLLQISSSTLQNLRLNGTLPHTRIGGIIYYSSEEIQAVLTENTINNIEDL